jgi:hypothetical protein
MQNAALRTGEKQRDRETDIKPIMAQTGQIGPVTQRYKHTEVCFCINNPSIGLQVVDQTYPCEVLLSDRATSGNRKNKQSIYRVESLTL